MREIVGVAPSGSLGSGYNLAAFRNALMEEPDFIGQDAGSTDMGPHYHGKPATFLPRQTYKHDLAIMLEAARAPHPADRRFAAHQRVSYDTGDGG